MSDVGCQLADVVWQVRDCSLLIVYCQLLIGNCLLPIHQFVLKDLFLQRSRTSFSVLAEATQLAKAGYTEIQLLGQNVNSYRDPSSTAWRRLKTFCSALSRMLHVL